MGGPLLSRHFSFWVSGNVGFAAFPSDGDTSEFELQVIAVLPVGVVALRFYDASCRVRANYASRFLRKVNKLNCHLQQVQ